ncbi:hypothetical protein A6768_00910 [Sphingobium yanoikuyae]|uniref:Uncharacterized protein n=1 Tax=Sphingobium yanoikuyae TaxID=13690 RepID=A0A291MUT1_SPHYA|nr:hypothetical protein A6768_00910 [Sphingobium yanoikuyae]
MLLLELNKSDLVRRAPSQAANLGTPGIYQKAKRFFKGTFHEKAPQRMIARGQSGEGDEVRALSPSPQHVSVAA